MDRILAEASEVYDIVSSDWIVILTHPGLIYCETESSLFVRSVRFRDLQFLSLKKVALQCSTLGCKGAVPSYFISLIYNL